MHVWYSNLHYHGSTTISVVSNYIVEQEFTIILSQERPSLRNYNYNIIVLFFFSLKKVYAQQKQCKGTAI